MVTPGGSSGGEGALIALRGSPLGVGTDIAGKGSSDLEDGRSSVADEMIRFNPDPLLVLWHLRIQTLLISDTYHGTCTLLQHKYLDDPHYCWPTSK
jgi:hypothetical protein